jgi:cyclic pyranopterin phosphate synthase
MLADQFKRKIDYLRVSVTDRCDLRCTYCMAEDVTFLPRQEVLSIEEIVKLIDVF